MASRKFALPEEQASLLEFIAELRAEKDRLWSEQPAIVDVKPKQIQKLNARIAYYVRVSMGGEQT